MADGILACASCYGTIVAEANGIPCVVMDDTVPEIEKGYLKIVNSYSKVQNEITKLIEIKEKTTDILNIIYDIVNNNVKKIDL